MKRTIDVVLAAIALIASAPVQLAIAAAVRLDSPGPVLYRTVRVGRHETLFTLYKFRTMRHRAEGLAVTAAGDARVTRVGRMLRRYKLDELPQLFNVLRGDMALVGPRPEDPRYVALYTPEQKRVFDVRPGLTGPTALAYRDEETLLAGRADVEFAYVREVLPAKLRLDLDYLERATLAGDLRILAATVGAIVRRGRGANADRPEAAIRS